MNISMGIVIGDFAVVTDILVSVGSSVKNGDELLYVEMQKGVMPILAGCDGVVAELRCSVGDKVKQGDLLLRIDDAEVQENKVLNSALPVEDKSTDLLIIGGGPGGYVAAIYAAKKGLHVTLVEKDRLGGACLNYGCIPTKTLVKSSSVYQAIKGSAVFGVECSAATVDIAKVIQRKNTVISQLVGGVEGLMGANRITVLSGKATFSSETTVDVVCKNQLIRVSAKDIIIATGAVPARLNIPGADLPCVIDSTDALNMENLPSSIVIIGGGVIGIEFAFLYANFGIQVTVVEYLDRVIPTLDKEISSEIEKIAKKRGIKIFTSSKVLEIQQDINKQAIISFEHNGEISYAVSDITLMAVGRAPYTDGLALDIVQVAFNDNGRGVKINRQMQTNVPHIYAIGDVTNGIQLAHVASHQGIVAVENILGNERHMDYEAIPSVIFTEPEIASVGKTPEDCAKSNISYTAGKFDFYANGKALTMNEKEGFVKLIQDSHSRKILGGSIIGPDASSLIACLALAVQNGLRDTDIAATVFPHPTTGEALHEAALSFSCGAIHGHDNR